MLFDTVFIERQVASRPVIERRELRSLFKPKSAQVLRVMLRAQPGWRVTELAEMADVSLGHVSNVRAGLDREWARVSDDGLFLSEPDALLDARRDAYEPPAGERMTFYTTLHGSALEEAARRCSTQIARQVRLLSRPSRRRTGWRRMAGPARITSIRMTPVSSGSASIEAVLGLQRRECDGDPYSKIPACSATPSSRHGRNLHQPDPDLSRSDHRRRRGEGNRSSATREVDMAEMTPNEPQSAADYGDRTTAAVKRAGRDRPDLGSFKAKIRHRRWRGPMVVARKRGHAACRHADVDLGWTRKRWAMANTPR